MADVQVETKKQNQEEYLTLLQTAFLIGQSEQNTLENIKRGKIQAVKRMVGERNRIFVPVNSLEMYVSEIVKKYSEAVKYLDLPDEQKVDYLKEILPDTYAGYSPDPTKYLTVIQVAFLIKRSRQAVYDLIRKGVFQRIKGSRTTLISIEDFAVYILDKMERIRPAIFYLTEDSFSFWSEEKGNYERFYQENGRKGGSDVKI